MKKLLLSIGFLLCITTGSASALNTVSLDVGDCVDIPVSSPNVQFLLKKQICFAGSISDSLVVNVLNSTIRGSSYESSTSSAYYLKRSKFGNSIKFQSMIIEYHIANNRINLTF